MYYKDKFKRITTLLFIFGGLSLAIVLMFLCIKLTQKNNDIPYKKSKLITPLELDLSGENGSDLLKTGTTIVTIYYEEEAISKQFVEVLDSIDDHYKETKITYCVMLYNQENAGYLSALSLNTYTDYFVFNEGQFLYRSYGLKPADYLVSEINGTIKYGQPDVDLNNTIAIGNSTIKFVSCNKMPDATENSFSYVLNFSNLETNKKVEVISELNTIDTEKVAFVVLTYSYDWDSTGQDENMTLLTVDHSNNGNNITVESSEHSYKTIQIRIYTASSYNDFVNGNNDAEYGYFNYRTWQ